MDWLKQSIWIGIYGFLKEFRPEDPYIVEYLTTNTMHFPEEVVYQEILPVATYVTLSLLIFVFLLTDWLRYKPVILMHAFSGIMMQVFLIWCRSKFWMYFMEASYGTMTACEVAYSTYIYAKVEKKYYQEVSGHTRAASQTGRFISGITSQVVQKYGMTIADLNYFTLGGITLAFFWALTLPSVRTSMYFHRSNGVVDYNDYAKTETGQAEITCTNEIEQEQVPVLKKVCSKNVVVQRLWIDFKQAFTNTYVLKWCIWWAIATCGYNQIMTYAQTLWAQIKNDNESEDISWNGGVEATYTLLSALATLAMGHAKIDWRIFGEPTLAVCTLIQGFLVLWSSQVNKIFYAYIVYVVFGVLYHVMMTVCTFEVAKKINNDSFALVFGINLFVATALQALLTLIVTDSSGPFKLLIREQYVVFGCFFITLGIMFALKVIWSLITGRLRYTPS